MKKLSLIGLFLCFSFSLCAGSLRLLNDTPYKLRVVIYGAEGSYLGEQIMLPQHTSTWSDEYGGGIEQPDRSVTPYSVHWHCMDGSEFSIYTMGQPGALVSASIGEGKKICQRKKKKRGKAEEESLQDDDDQSCPCPPSESEKE